MSKEADTDTPAAEPAFVCGVEASALLNCVASKQYSEAKCKPLLQKLRSCIEKKKVVKFSLLPDEESSKKPEDRKKESKQGK
ncbi:hypothetical protein ABBQ32_009665 [Trebouxia sp. C0010 RCD-2024]